MIVGLSITLVVLVIGTWLYMVYISWKASEAISPAVATYGPLLARLNQALRLTRRGWYGASLQGRKTLAWFSQKAQTTFIKIFPTAKSAFTKRDMMTGLTHGPSSYFLKTISQPRKKASKRLPRIKKVV